MADLDDIYAYGLERWGFRQAERYQDALFSIFDGLAAGSVATRPFMDGYRKASSGSHFVIYREDEGVIYVTRVLHQQMDIERRL
jgi:toxin ParE1/3/4